MDPDEEEPSLEEAWPHLQIVYELLLKFIMTNQLTPDQVARYLNEQFIQQMVELFHSEDPRERDYLKTMLHRIYGKFMTLRAPIRKHVMNLFLNVTYEFIEPHNGLSELLEILGSIISGFTVPLKHEHIHFLKNAIVPLHRVKTLSLFHS